MPEWLTTLIAATIGTVVPLLAWWRQLRKDRKDAELISEKKQQEIEEGLWLRASERIDALEKDVKATYVELEEERRKRRMLEEVVTEYRLGLLILIDQLRNAGIEPKWLPPETLKNT